ncbi:hypothetical protein [Microcoleus sp. D3_18_C2]|uniref:hypothetical protein n=1 Tax=Microcoleus sp. D3_18_C2 TaxID=3055334 RepID=UPI002FD1A413
MPVPQKVNFILVEQAEKPVHKKLIDNGATSQSYPRVQLLGAKVCFSLRGTATQDGNTYLKIGEHRSAPPSATPYNDNCTGDRAIASTAIIIFNAGN